MLVRSQNLGKISELEFAKRCLDLGYVVSAPLVDVGGYDFLVENGNEIKRIQVRSTETLMKASTQEKRYKVNCTKKNGFDLMALYIYTLDLWYIIPNSLITGKTIMVSPFKNVNRKSKFDVCINNWNFIFGNV